MINELSYWDFQGAPLCPTYHRLPLECRDSAVEYEDRADPVEQQFAQPVEQA